MIALCGQIVTVTGGSGFANADIHRTIRADLIKQSADALAHCVNTQVLPPWAFELFGESIIEDLPRVEWDVKPPEDRKVEAEALKTAADATAALIATFESKGVEIDVAEIATRFGIPVTGKKVKPPEKPEETDAEEDANDASKPADA